MQKLALLFLILSILFTAFTFVGIGYVLINHGIVNAGYTCIPIVFAVAFTSLYKNSKK